jgi:hypothetical protein
MSLPQFKELIAIAIENEIQANVSYLVEQRQADLPTLRGYQGQIAGLKLALELIGDTYRKMYG